MSAAFSRAYERKIKIAERKNFRAANIIYMAGFEKATELLLTTANLNHVELMPAQNLFNVKMFDDLFNQIYLDTGLEFALWYQRTFEKFIKKGEGFTDIWTNAFTVMGARSAGEAVTSIQGTAKKAFVSNIKGLMSDPDFVELSTPEKARILRRKGYWKKEAAWMAKRVARTESNAAANYALEVSAKSMFPTTPLLKKCITSIDGRERDTHRAANGQTRKEDEFFDVGGVKLKRPGARETAIGDSKAIAGEVINCRCRIEIFPDPEAVEREIGGFRTDLLFQISLAGLSTMEEQELFN